MTTKDCFGNDKPTLEPLYWYEIPKRELARLDEQEDLVLWRAETLGHGIRFVRYDVVRLTPEGFWLTCEDWDGLRKTWRAKNTNFASPTRREALVHLHRRKCSYVKHSQRRLNEAKKQLVVVERALQEIKRNGTRQ